MPGPDDILQMRKDFHALQTQVEKLTDAVNKAPLVREATTVAKDDDGDDGDLRYLNNRKVDEVSRFFRGLVFASLEATRVAAQSVASLTAEASVRNVPKPNESMTDVARRLPSDISRSVVRGIDDALDIPSAAINRFNDIYRDPKQGARTTRRRTRIVRDVATAATGGAVKAS